MRRTPLNSVGKKKCRKHHPECKDVCSQCRNPKPVFEVKKRKAINPISAKKRVEIENEKPIREVLAKRADGYCEKCGRPWWASVDGLHPHERKFRSHGGKMSESNSLLLCSFCHSSAHGIRVIEH